MMTNEEIWKIVLGEIELSVPRPTFLTWFKNTTLAERKDGVFMVQVPNAFTKEWLESKYEKQLMRVVRNHAPEVRDLDFVIGREATRKITPPQHMIIEQPSGGEVPLPFQEELVDKETNLNPRYLISTFIVGPSNELAHSAAVAITKQPGTLYNPLFIYGGVGLGKTHLLHAIGNDLVQKNAGLRICYVSCEKFISEFIASIRQKNTGSFKDQYRNLDVLLIDDVQFIAGKEISQEELFHTFNSLYEKSKQVVFSSDRPPKSIPTIEERLRSRFEGGMIADIGFPDFETRVAILMTKAQERRVELTSRVANAIAKMVERNIRELEGALNRIIAAAQSAYIDMEESDLRRILAGAMLTAKKPTWRQIILAVGGFYDVDESELFNKSRKQDVVRPRQIAMYMMREELKSSYPFIGSKFGGRDHTTVIHACDKIDKEIQANGPIVEELICIRERLRAQEYRDGKT